MTLEEGLELISNYKKALEKFLETLPEQSVQLGSKIINILSMNSKNEIKNLDAIEKALKRQPNCELGLNNSIYSFSCVFLNCLNYQTQFHKFCICLFSCCVLFLDVFLTINLHTSAL